MAKKKLKLKKAGDGKNIRGGTFWGHRKSENDSELENAFEYVPVIGNLASVNDWMDATQNFAQNPNWNNFGKATLETAGLIPFGKAFTSGLKNGKLLNKANRAGLFLESALNYASDENAPSIFSSDKKIEKKGNGGRAPIKGTKEQYQAYQDSLDLFNYTNLQHQLEPSWSVIQGNAFQNLGIGQDSEFAKNQHRLFNTADSLIRNNPRLEWGTYGDPFADSKGQNSLREQYSSRGGNSPDIRSKGNVIKPANFWTGAAANHDYIQPVQPIIYQPEEKKSNSISLTPDEFSKHSQVIERNGRKYKVNYTSGGFDGVTSFEQPINLQSSKPDLLQGNNQQLEFNPIGFKKGSYFTTNDDEQERDTQGKKGVRYWDKTTGKRLMGNGGDVKYPLITEGGYDIKRAIELGYEPDGDGHLPSRDYETGQYLKAKNYYTTPMSIINDELLGYKQRQDINGNLYSIPRDQQYPDFDLNNPPARTFKNGGKVNTDWEIVQDDNEWELV